MSQITVDKVLKYFEQIASHPRMSGEEGAIRGYLIDWAKMRDYVYRVDDAGNIVIYAPGTTSSEMGKLALQSHIDMVCTGEPHRDYDPLITPITTILENGILKADGTSLGADNGIGMALMLVAADVEIRPDLELLFTVDEERGLIGAKNINPSLITATKLLNLDNEMNHEVCIGTAGLAIIRATFPTSRTQTDREDMYMFQIKSLRGGHSGVDIHRPFGNAILWTAELLLEYPGEYELCYFNGGVAENAIPASTTCEILLSDPKVFTEYLGARLDKYKSVYDAPDAQYVLEKLSGLRYQPFADKDVLLTSLLKAGTGIVEFDSERIDSVVSTSYNLAIIHTTEVSIDTVYTARSFKEEKMVEILNRIDECFHRQHKRKEVLHSPWLESDDAPFVDQILTSMQKVHPGAHTSVIHAALETCVLDNALPNTRVASIGPMIYHPHSTDEHIHLKDIELYCRYLEQIISDWGES